MLCGSLHVLAARLFVKRAWDFDENGRGMPGPRLLFARLRWRRLGLPQLARGHLHQKGGLAGTGQPVCAASCFSPLPGQVQDKAPQRGASRAVSVGRHSFIIGGHRLHLRTDAGRRGGWQIAKTLERFLVRRL